MEEKQKVWIRVPQGKEKEAVEVLKKRGGRYGYGYELNIEDLAGDVLFIDHDGNIVNAGTNYEFTRMLEDYYTEIMIDEPWKDGDILVRDDRNGKEFVVFEKMRSEALFSHYPLFKGDSTMLLLASDYRKALSKETRMFKELLASHGQEWDEEMKRVVRKVYEPLKGETFYYIVSSGVVLSEHWGNNPFQPDTRRFGNCFKTREEAVRAARKIRALLLDADDEDREK